MLFTLPPYDESTSPYRIRHHLKNVEGLPGEFGCDKFNLLLSVWGCHYSFVCYHRWELHKQPDEYIILHWGLWLLWQADSCQARQQKHLEWMRFVYKRFIQYVQTIYHCVFYILVKPNLAKVLTISNLTLALFSLHTLDNQVLPPDCWCRISKSHVQLVCWTQRHHTTVSSASTSRQDSEHEDEETIALLLKLCCRFSLLSNCSQQYGECFTLI